MKNENYYTVRNELKKLRLLDRMIASLENEEERTKRYLGPAKSECEREDGGNTALRNAIESALELRNKYYPLISKLDSLDRIIILEGYIGKKPYWKLGNEIGYSKDGIQKRTYIIINKLAQLL